ncbi:MAG: hypothetical protein ABI778_06545 [Ignavibacteriota bacterium]
MLDSKQREAQLMQARERLARAFTRLDGLLSLFPERIRLLESSRSKSDSRIAEIEELLVREKAITAQSKSLSEGVTEELQLISAKLQRAEQALSERDNQLADFDKELGTKGSELLANERAHIESLEREEMLKAALTTLESMNSDLLGQLELLKDEREKLQSELSNSAKKTDTFALLFTQGERLSLLKTVDSIIERVDGVIESTAGGKK